jgi:hypothetical protein
LRIEAKGGARVAYMQNDVCATRADRPILAHIFIPGDGQRGRSCGSKDFSELYSSFIVLKSRTALFRCLSEGPILRFEGNRSVENTRFYFLSAARQEAHHIAVNASSLFAAADQATKQWARRRWSAVVKVQIADRSWSVRAEKVMRSRQGKQPRH